MMFIMQFYAYHFNLLYYHIIIKHTFNKFIQKLSRILIINFTVYIHQMRKKNQKFWSIYILYKNFDVIIKKQQ